MSTPLGFRRIHSSIAVLSVGLLSVAGATPAVAAPTAQCAARDGYQIAVQSGDLGCDTAYGIAAAYDRDGDKYQVIGDFTCYSAVADVYPIVLLCVSGDTEFAVSQT